MNRLLLSPIGPNSPRPDDPAEGAVLEEPVPVGFPARAGQQLVLDRLVVSHLRGAHVGDGTQMERRRGDDRSFRQVPGPARAGEQAR